MFLCYQTHKPLHPHSLLDTQPVAFVFNVCLRLSELVVSTVCGLVISVDYSTAHAPISASLHIGMSRVRQLTYSDGNPTFSLHFSASWMHPYY